MSTIYTIQNDESLDRVWSELVYTEARLTKDKRTVDLADSIAKLVARCEQTQLSQRAVWRAEIVAQAGVDYADELLDETVDEVSHNLLHIERDRTSPRYRRYFREASSAIIRLGLEAEVDRVRAWPASLSTEPEKPLQKVGSRLADDIKAGDEALKERRDAVAATADHRVREIVRLIEDCNAARRSLLGELITRGESNKLPAEWATGFFRKSTRTAKKKPVAELPEAPPLK
jgi:hypothetical protein